MKTKYIAISALALLFTACQQGGNVQHLLSNGEMIFNVATTRVANDTFEAEDKIGVYVTDYVDSATPAPLQISGNRANNEGVIFDGTKWTAERPIYWGKGKSDVYAYYPYMEIEDVDSQPFSVALDQTIEGAYEASDLLWAKAEGVAQTDGAVSLQMQHSMSRLVVKIMAGEEYVGSLPKDATVHLHSTVTDARFSIAKGSIAKDPYGGAHSIQMRNCGIHTFAEGEAVVYEAIVVPQMLETSVPLLEINSKSVSYLLEDMFNFRPGVSYTYTAVLNTSTTAIKVQIGCEIEDWNNIGGSEGEGGSGSGSEGGEDDGIDLSLYTDLSAEGTANCYLIKGAGNYKFKAVVGNTDWSVGNVKKTEVLWESFGTDVKPKVGDLIKEVGYKNGYVYFSTPETFANGNASIAVRNSKDVVLWSWHIWCSEEGWNDHIYANNAGTMMDRHLGATSAQRGNTGNLGLFYNPGRVSPLMGTCNLASTTLAVSTGTWSTHSFTSSSSQQEMLNYIERNPMTILTGTYSINKLWNEEEKSLYDPCPVGYCVPDADFWEKSQVSVNGTSDSIQSGIYWELNDGSKAWYPQTGTLQSGNTTDNNESYVLTKAHGALYINTYTTGSIQHSNPSYPTYGCAVRCMKEK